MALPAKGDPRRPLFLAIRSARLLGVIGLIFGACIVYVLTIMMAAHFSRGGAVGLGAIAVVYGGGGVAFLVLVTFLKRRKLWAVVTCVVLSSFLLLFSVLGAITLLIQMERLQNVSAVRLIVAFLAVAAFVQFTYHLCQSFEAIKYVSVEEQPGFDPLMPLPGSTPPPSLPPAAPRP